MSRSATGARLRNAIVVAVSIGVAASIILSSCASSDGPTEEGAGTTVSTKSSSDTTRRRATTTTTKKKATTTTTTKKKATTTTEPEDDGPACESYWETQYIPARSTATFERNGVEVQVQRVYHRNLTLEVTSSDGTYDHDQVDPDTTLFEGLVVTTSQLGFDWVWDYFKGEFVLEPGQVKTVLHVYDCWTYLDGPDDLF